MTSGQQKRLEEIKKARTIAEHFESDLFLLWSNGRYDPRLLDDSMRADHELKLRIKEYKALYKEEPE